MRLIVSIVLTLTACSMSFASNTLIEGFAKWQADRIERIAVDQALEDIAANTYVKKYFSKTSSSIEFYDSISGQRLIPLMQVYFQEESCEIRVAIGENRSSIMGYKKALSFNSGADNHQKNAA